MKRFWASKMAARQGEPVPPARRAEWDLDQIVFGGLNLAVEETLQFLMQTAPTFEEFERWVLQGNGGRLDPRQVARLNAAVAGELPTRPLPIPAGEDCPAPVLSAAAHAHWDEHGYVVVRDGLPPGADPQKQDLSALGPKPIAANAGDLIIWHHALPLWAEVWPKPVLRDVNVAREVLL